MSPNHQTPFRPGETSITAIQADAVVGVPFLPN
jgi:hypothetical protein